MRTLAAFILGLVASVMAFGLTAEAALVRSLDFLRGVWIAEYDDRPSQVMDFRWIEREGHLVLVGRRWFGRDYACPSCVTKTALVARYDALQNTFRLHLVDRSQQSMDLHLVSTARNSAQFLTESGLDLPVYRLTYTVSQVNVLSLMVEEAKPDGSFGFVQRLSERFLRR